MSANRKQMLRSTMGATLFILISKGIGFIREMIMADIFGANALTDAYNSAYSLFYLPVLLFSSCISSTLVPEYLRCEHELGDRKASRFASNTLNLFSLTALILSIIMMLFADGLVSVVYPGFDPETHALTVKLSRVMFPALMFFTAGLVLSSLLNAKERFIAAQLTGIPLSAAEITAALFFSKKYGIDAQAWAVIASGILQVLVLFPFLKGLIRFSAVLDTKDSYFRRLIKLAGPAVLAMAVNELNHMIDRMLASGLNGGDISAMTYAFKLIMFMMGVLVVPLTTVSFSQLSKDALHENGQTLVIPQVRESIKMLLTALLPLVIISAIESRHMMRFAYGRGAFTEENVRVTGTVFLFYVVGLPFFGVRDLLNRVYHAFEDTKTPMVIAMISMAVNIVLNLILRKLMGVNGLAFATGIAALVGVILLFALLRRKVKGMFDRKFVLDLMKLVLCNVPMFIVCFIMSRLIPETYGTLYVFLRLAAIAVVSLGVYAVMLFMTNKALALAVVNRVFSRFIRRKKKN